MSVKGDWPRPVQVSKEEHELRKRYAWQDPPLTEKEFNRKLMELKKRKDETHDQNGND